MKSLFSAALCTPRPFLKAHPQRQSPHPPLQLRDPRRILLLTAPKLFHQSSHFIARLPVPDKSRTHIVRTKSCTKLHASLINSPMTCCLNAAENLLRSHPSFFSSASKLPAKSVQTLGVSPVHIFNCKEVALVRSQTLMLCKGAHLISRIVRMV
jgi:hypothetical protein